MDYLDDGDKELEARLLGTTAKIPWSELQRFFARGRVLHIAAELDLIQVARQLVDDNAEQFKQWADAGQVAHVDDKTAADWFEQDKLIWATVVAPWVLVQDKQSGQDAG